MIERTHGPSRSHHVRLSDLRFLNPNTRILEQSTAAEQASLQVQEPEIILKLIAFAGNRMFSPFTGDDQMISTQALEMHTTRVTRRIMSAT